MPFTLSHAAAVLPGLRRDGTARGPLVTSALVMGSFSPDVTYFAASVVPNAMVWGDFTHGLIGLLTVDVVLTALLVALWWVVRDPVLALLPPAWHFRGRAWLTGPPIRWGPSYVVRFAVSAVIGAATHIFWDSFTHEGRWGTRVVPVLGETWGGFGVHKFAQYGSSAIALVVIGAFAVSALRRQSEWPPPAEPSHSVSRWQPLDRPIRRAVCLTLLAFALGGALQRCFVLYQTWDGDLAPLDLIPTACFGAGAGWAIGVLLYAAVARSASAMRVPGARAHTETVERAPSRPGGEH
ncbi:DUF4184 family protein [Streptomyces sp. NPDC005963]|uniref:DUF4184 family protein n=1 Tax=Streptomyces sp. NPDC005963 TaxID=3156721 RepID=UPI003411AFC2